MPAVQRQGDSNSAGGQATGGVTSVLVNGRPIIVTGGGVTGHAPWGPPHPPHASATVKGGSASVRADGKLVIRTGDTDTCGHPRSGGSVDVRAA